MKKIILGMAIAILAIQAHAQKMDKKDVPSAVSSAFTTAYPTVKDVEWKKDGNNYTAEYDMDKHDVYVTYDASGTMLEKKEPVAKNAIPSAIMDYVKKTYKEDEIRTIYKVTDASGNVTYKAKMKGNWLVFDSNGNFVK